MPINPLTSRRLKQLRTIHLPEVQKSSRIAFALGVLLSTLLVLALVLYSLLGPRDNTIRSLFASQEYGELVAELEALRANNLQLKEDADRNAELLKLDKDDRNKLTLLIANLEAENAKLKEDLAFFEGFIPGTEKAGISMRRLMVTKDSVPDQYRYKALVIQGADRNEITLTVQLVIRHQAKDKIETLILPTQAPVPSTTTGTFPPAASTTPPQPTAPQYKVKLTRFARVSGTFNLPKNNKLISVELRVLEAGAIRASQTIKL